MTRMVGVASVVLAGLTAGTAVGQQKQPVTGPVANYWVSVSTTSGMAAMMEGAGGGAASGGRPSIGGMMGMMMRGGPRADSVTHHMTLQLGSERTAASPQAEHLPPSSLKVGTSLPLVTPPEAPKATPSNDQPSVEKYRQQKPKGKMLIFWGCGEHVGPGQPIVIDFAKFSADPASMAHMGEAFRSFPVSPEHPPAAGHSATYGDWPNNRSSVAVPSDGSLVGEHLVRGDYTPDIHFSLRQDQDFMGPFILTSNARTATGAIGLAWSPVSGALGYLATAVGAGADRETMVMWVSSQVQAAGFAAPQYLSNGEIRHMVEQRYLLGPETTSCLVPQEVATAAPNAMLSMTAYGGEANFADPPRPPTPKPWNISWTVKVRYRSATMAMLGQPMPGGRGERGESAPRPDPVRSLMGGFIPH